MTPGVERDFAPFLILCSATGTQAIARFVGDPTCKMKRRLALDSGVLLARESWGYKQGVISESMKSCRRWEKAGWERCIAPAIPGSAAMWR